MTKTEMVLKHLQRYGTITTWTAITKYKATRLSAIIFNLKEQGYDIWSERKSKKDKNGNYEWWVAYHLKKGA